MSTPIMVWKYEPDQNRLARLNLAVDTLDEGTQRLPGGGYTVFRTWAGGRVLRLEDHFERLEESAHLTGREVKIHRDLLRGALRETVSAFPGSTSRIRVILDLQQRVGTFYILVAELKTPSAVDYEQGVKVVTRWMQRENPKAKQTSFIGKAAQVRQTLPPGMNEAVMVSESGRVLEGLSSNFFAVWEGMIWTAEEGVLSGITRKVVLDCIQDRRIPLRLEGLWRESLVEADEAFITSASRAVLPVTEIDGRPVGDGKPGMVTVALMRAYQERIEAELELL